MALQTQPMSYDEKVALAAPYIAFNEQPLREDRPETTARLQALRLTLEGLDQEQVLIRQEINALTAQLLTDAELDKVAEVGRQVRDHDFPPDVTPVTPCPDWCEMVQHVETRVGKWHEGALTSVYLAHPDATTGRDSLSCSVDVGDENGSDVVTLDICASTHLASADEARQFAAGVLRAADLYDRLLANTSDGLSGRVIPPIEGLG